MCGDLGGCAKEPLRANIPETGLVLLISEE
jgi:hypothetical protein